MTPSNPLNPSGTLRARLDASLVVNPNLVIKSNGSRIEVEMSASLIAEGSAGNEIIFTSLHDDRYGFGGTFDTNNNGIAGADQDGDGNIDAPLPQEGGWSGIYFAQTSSGSLDHIVLAYGGGASRVAGGVSHFNAIEVHQANVRIANSLFEENGDGRGVNDPGETRAGHSSNATGTIFVRGAQPIIVNNNIRNNASAAININVNSLNSNLVVDWGRSTGLVDITPGVGDNQGALIRNNLVTNNGSLDPTTGVRGFGVNGMIVRGGVLTTQSVWDDTDIVHVLFDEVVIPDLHTYGGLRIESSSKESLIVKLLGEDAGITASGTPLDIDDRIGGMLQVIGQPGYPVVFTSLFDDTVGAGFDENGVAAVDTDNLGDAQSASAGDWRSLLIDEYANDRNVDVIVESESNNASSVGTNGSPQSAQALGILAPDEFAGDDNRRLGFEVHGYLSSPADVDVYSFKATPGTEVWLDLDRTTYALDAIIELIDDAGNVIARSTDNDSIFGNYVAADQVNLMPKSGTYDQDRWTINPSDPGMRIVLPGNPSSSNSTFHVRIRSNSANLGTEQHFSSGSYLVSQDQLTSGLTSGVYQLQIRLREVDEFGGSTIKQADVRYATNGIEVYGQPAHSPLLGESAEDDNDNNDTQGGAHNVGNLLNTDRDAISIAAGLADRNDVDWFEFELTRDLIQQIPGFSADELFASLMIDLDYMGGDRGNAQIAVYDASGQLVLVSRDSSIGDDQTNFEFVANPDYDPDYTPMADQTRGSLATTDPYIGTVHVPQGTYYVAVSSTAQISNQLSQFYEENPTNPLVRLEPVDSVQRIVEEHIGTNTTSTAAAPDIAVFLRNSDHTKDYHLSDMVMFVSVDVGAEQTQVWAINPFTGAVEAYIGQFGYDVGDIGMRPDGSLFAYSLDTVGGNAPIAANNGNFIQINTGTGAATFIRDDGLQTYTLDDGDPAVDHVIGGTGFGYGYYFNALAYGYLSGNPDADDILGFAVGNHAGGGPAFGQTNGQNILFRVDASDADGNTTPTGVVIDSNGSPNDGANNDTNGGRAQGIAGTDARAVGQIDTSFDPVGIGASSVIVSSASRYDDDGETVNSIYQDGDSFIIDGDGDLLTLGDQITVQFNMGDELNFESLNRLITTDPTTSLITRSGGPAVTEGLTFSDGTNTYEIVYDQFLDFSNVNSPLSADDEGSAIVIEDESGNRLFLYLEDIAEADANDGFASANGFNAATDLAVAVNYRGGTTTREALIQAVQQAIHDNTAENNPASSFEGSVYRSGDRLAILNDADIQIIAGDNDGTNIFGGVVVDGQNATANVAVVIDIAATELELAEAVEAAIDGAGAVTPSRFGTRMTIDAAGADYSNLVAAGLVDLTSNSASTGDVVVNIGAASTAEEIADAIAAAVDAEADYGAVSGTGGRITFTYQGGDATVSANNLFQVGGVGSGGTITGLAIMETELYAVDNNGGVFFLDNPTSTTTFQADYLGQILDANDNPVRFVSLEAGPRVVEADDAYSNILFGMSDTGVMYAITIQQDVQGYPEAVLAPVFAGGRTSIATSLVSANISGTITGVAMGTLNRNLWHTTTTRENDPGHGIDVPITGWRDAEAGGVSFYFGNEADTFGENNAYGNATSDNYDFPQGAHGTLITEDFSLEGYDAGDLPVLYFNYYSDTDNVNGDLARDSLRVFIAGDDGNWEQLTTNNNYMLDGEFNDEFDAFDKETLEARAVGTTQAVNGAGNTVQPTYDNTNTWRQVRIDLSQFAGQDNLKLRFDFATGGQINIGGVGRNEAGQNFAADTTEIRALDSYKHDDGEVFSITDPYSGEVYYFELNKGQTLGVGTADLFNDGDLFTLTTNHPTTPVTRTFEFDTVGDGGTVGDNVIYISVSDTPETIAEKLRIAIKGDVMLGTDVRVFRTGHELTIRDIVDIGNTQTPEDLVLVDDGSGPILGLQIDGTEEGRGANTFTTLVNAAGEVETDIFELHTIDLHDSKFITENPEADG
ncbi:MAG: hypothetical protein ACIALR_16025, partial [Blastopirellula sp. JB062]